MRQGKKLKKRNGSKKRKKETESSGNEKEREPRRKHSQLLLGGKEAQRGERERERDFPCERREFEELIDRAILTLFAVQES